MTATSKTSDIRQLDTLTDGAFSASTSGERATRVRAWLSREPSQEQLQEVFRELGARDKGAARPIRERLDELRRARTQEAVAAEWAGRAQTLLDAPKLNIADALAWQRDAAKAGAPLSREPLQSLKAQLADRVRVIEDLQHRVQVQREAAVLLAQRIEVLSTKPWEAAQGVWDALRVDVAHWQEQATALEADASWSSVDLKFPPLLEASRAQLLVVWEAFQTALSQAVAAAGDPTAPLPAVPVWADALRAARGVPADAPPKPARPKVDPEVRQRANDAVREALQKLEAEVAEGHGKASAGAAGALRNALKEHGKLVDDALENQAHAALAAAGELEGWQRWRADQLRQELVDKAEALLKRPPGQAIGGRKMQETLRGLREQWKQTDQGGIPNHAMWKRFDDACNEAHKVVEAWVEKVKAAATEHRAQRLALIDELKAWAAENRKARDDDWRGFARVLHQFADRWRDAGHVGEKVFAELQHLWKTAHDEASAPLQALQQQSLQQRQAMIEEAQALGAQPVLRIDAVKALQQRWQAEAQSVPMERRQEQKLWDAFRKPIDEAFARKSAEREKAEAALGEHDRRVLDAAKALEQANAGGDAQAIRGAMQVLEAALRGQAAAATAMPSAAAPASTEGGNGMPAPAVEAIAAEEAPSSAAEGAGETANAPEKATPKAPVRPVVAVRGDDRPGLKRGESAAIPARGVRPGDRRDGPRGAQRGERRDRDGDRDSRFGGRERSAGGLAVAPPRLGDAAFRAQRDALERAQTSLRKLASQAHGEALAQLFEAWQHRDAERVPSAQELGARVNAAVRGSWIRALAQAPGAPAEQPLLRLEIAADVPTPAQHHSARRMYQLQLLTRRNDAPPSETWAQDVAKVLEGGFDGESERRLRTALKVLLKT